jgi:hypothetical protein
VRRLLGVIAYNLGNLVRPLVLPLAIQSWSLKSLQQRLFKTGGLLIRHARLHPPAGPEPLDADALSADSQAHRATRVASDVIEPPGQGGEQGRQPAAAVSRGGEPRAADSQQIRDRRRWRRKNAVCHLCEWAAGSVRTSRRHSPVWTEEADGSISEIPV